MLPQHIFRTHRHIGLDLDETLADSMKDVLGSLHKKGKMQTVANFESLSSFDWMKLPGCDLSFEELTLVWRLHMLTSVSPVPYSKLGVDHILEQEKSISVVTARNDEDHREDTYRWIGLHFPEIRSENIHFANHSAGDAIPKSELCTKLGITLFIDDAMHNAEDLVTNGISCIILEKPWNRGSDFSHPNLYRVRDWQEIIDNLESR